MASRFKRWLEKFNRKEKFIYDKERRQVTMVFDVDSADKAYQLKSKIETFMQARSFIENEVDWNTNVDIQLVWGLIHSSIKINQRKIISLARYELNIPEEIDDRDVFEAVLKNKHLFTDHPFFRALDTKEALKKNQSMLKRLVIKELGDAATDIMV